MAAKTTFIATAPDGEEFTRSTARVYTHAVLVFGQGWYEKKHNLPASWGQISFNGREELAVKEAAKWIGHYEQVIVVPVSPKAKKGQA